MSNRPAPYHGGAAHVHAPAYSPTSIPVPLSGLILDTVELLGEGVPEDAAATACDALWKARIYGGDAPEVEIEGLAPMVRVSVSSKGGVYPLMLSCPHWRLQLGVHEKGGVALHAKARLILSAESLAAHGTEWAVLEARRIGWWLWGTRTTWLVQRVDVACDFLGTHARDFAEVDGCVTRAAGGRVFMGAPDDAAEADDASVDATDAYVHSTRREVTSVTLGSAASRVQLCIYDKGKQAHAKQLAWALTSLEARGWDGVSTVTRIEARFRSRALDEFPDLELRRLESLKTWHEWAPRLWAYATTKTVRYCYVGRDSNRARWETRHDWRAISSVGSIAPRRVRAVAESVREERKRRASRDFVRAAERLAGEDERCTQLALDLSNDCVAKGQPALLGLVAAVMTLHGNVIEQRALPRLDDVERAAELSARISRRRIAIAWHDDPSLSIAMDPTERRAA